MNSAAGARDRRRCCRRVLVSHPHEVIVLEKVFAIRRITQSPIVPPSMPVRRLSRKFLGPVILRGIADSDQMPVGVGRIA